jgi:hypothetical protein
MIVSVAAMSGPAVGGMTEVYCEMPQFAKAPFGLAKVMADFQDRDEADIARDLDHVDSVLEPNERVDLEQFPI